MDLAGVWRVTASCFIFTAPCFTFRHPSFLVILHASSLPTSLCNLLQVSGLIHRRYLTTGRFLTRIRAFLPLFWRSFIDRNTFGLFSIDGDTFQPPGHGIQANYPELRSVLRQTSSLSRSEPGRVSLDVFGEYLS